MEKTKYSKPILSRKQFLKESGYPREMVDRALHCWFADKFSFRSSDKPKAKFFIVCDEFEYFRRQGEFK